MLVICDEPQQVGERSTVWQSKTIWACESRIASSLYRTLYQSEDGPDLRLGYFPNQKAIIHSCVVFIPCYALAMKRLVFSHAASLRRYYLGGVSEFDYLESMKGWKQ